MDNWNRESVELMPLNVSHDRFNNLWDIPVRTPVSANHCPANVREAADAQGRQNFRICASLAAREAEQVAGTHSHCGEPGPGSVEVVDDAVMTHTRVNAVPMAMTADKVTILDHVSAVTEFPI
jgi:hypothetical protein